MKRLLGALLAGTAMLSPALAADMAVKAPVVSPAYNWTGFYLGLSGGYAWQDLVIVIDPATGVDSTVRAASGGLIGGQIGYNWQSVRLCSASKAMATGPASSATRPIITA